MFHCFVALSECDLPFQFFSGPGLKKIMFGVVRLVWGSTSFPRQQASDIVTPNSSPALEKCHRDVISNSMFLGNIWIHLKKKAPSNVARLAGQHVMTTFAGRVGFGFLWSLRGTGILNHQHGPWVYVKSLMCSKKDTYWNIFSCFLFRQYCINTYWKRPMKWDAFRYL